MQDAMLVLDASEARNNGRDISGYLNTGSLLKMSYMCFKATLHSGVQWTLLGAFFFLDHITQQ